MSHVDHGWRHAPKAQGGTDPIPGGSGIQYDTYNSGNWLYVEATDGADFGEWAIQLKDSSPTADGIKITSSVGLVAIDGDTVNVVALGSVLSLQGATGIVLTAPDLEFVNIPTVNPGGTNKVWNNGGVLNIT